MKKQMFLTILAILSVLVVLAPIAGAAPPPQEERTTLTIAWIPKALNNPVFALGRDGSFEKARELTKKGPVNVDVVYTASLGSVAADQVRVVEDVITMGVDAIGISCNDPVALKDVIDKAVDAGIPVMTWDADSEESKRFTYLGVSNYEGGQVAARLLAKVLDGKGQVAMLTGVPGAANLEARMEGFRDEVAENYPDIEIVTTVACDDDILKGVEVVEETMLANPDLEGWFFVGLWPLFAAEGSMPLWEEAAKTGQVKTVAFDTLPVELEYMKKGMLQGLVGQKYWGWGYDTIQMIYDYIMEGKEYEDWTDSGMDIVCPNNVDEMWEMWDTSDFTKPLTPCDLLEE